MLPASSDDYRRTTPDSAAALVAQHERLVGYVLQRMASMRSAAQQRSILCSDEDLHAAGLIGLWRAAQAYDPTRGVTFGTFAAACIRSAIHTAIRDNTPGWQWRGRGAPPPAPRLVSLDETDADEQPLLQLGECDADLDVVDGLSPRVRAALDQLPERERGVLLACHLRGAEGAAIARTLGLSAQRVRQIDQRALQQVRGHLGIAPERPTPAERIAALSPHVQRVLQAQAIALELDAQGRLSWSQQGRFSSGPKALGTVHHAIAAVLGIKVESVYSQARVAQKALGVANAHEAVALWRAAHPPSTWDAGLRRCLETGRPAYRLRRRKPERTLTAMQQRYLALLAKGLSRRQIATLTWTPEYSVDNCLLTAYRVLGAHNVVEALAAWERIAPLHDVALPAVPEQMTRRRPTAERIPRFALPVLDRLAQGHLMPQISRELGLAYGTVDQYRSLGYRALGVQSKVQFALAWPRERERWVGPPVG